MTPEEVTRRNEAIALFMGMSRIEGVGRFAGEVFYQDYKRWESEGESRSLPFRSFQNTALRYHEDWSWLMPAVEKMLQSSNASMDMFRDIFSDPGAGEMFVSIGNLPDPTKITALKPMLIEATWMAVSEWVLSRETPEKQQQKV